MNVTVNLPDTLLSQTDKNAAMLHVKRSEYIRKALENMNKEVLKNEQYIRLQYLSKLVRGESMKINAEFEAIGCTAI